MNPKRFWITLVLFAVGLAAFSLYVNLNRPESADGDNAPAATQPAAANPQDAPAPAATAPATRPATADAQDAATAEAGNGDDAEAGEAPAPATAPAPRAAGRAELVVRTHPARSVQLGSVDPESGFNLQATVSSVAAGVQTVKLTHYYQTVADKMLARKHKGDHAAYLRAVAENPAKYKGHYRLLATLSFAGRDYRTLGTRSITLRRRGSRQRRTFLLDERNWKLVEGPVTDANGTQRARFAVTLYRDAGHDRPDTEPNYRPFLTISKTYAIAKGDYSLKAGLTVENHSGEQVSVAIDQFGPAGLVREGVRQDQRQVVRGELDNNGQVNVQRLGTDDLFQWAWGRQPIDEDFGQTQAAGETRPTIWAGTANKFFASLWYLKPDANDRLAPQAYSATWYAFAADTEDPYTEGPLRQFATGAKIGLADPIGQRKVARGQTVELAPGLKLDANSSVTIGMNLFAGPKERDILASDKFPLYTRLNYVSVIELGSCCFVAGWIAPIMVWLLEMLSWVAFGNYGVAIILLVVLVRALLHPMTRSSQVSMRRMQKLQPMMEEIKKKYADDAQTQQREMMKLMREQGAGQFLGCLPMLIQMPIWIALYTALNATASLRHAAFLPVWLTDLSAPDALVSWGFRLNIPLLSSIWGPVTGFNLLPILLAVAFFLNMKFNPQMAGASAPTKEQEAQKKMMMFMMPGMMLLFLYPAPSGLTLYIMTSTFAGLVEQHYIKKHIAEKEAAEAAQETVIDVPGKSSRKARPKKAKGPNFFKHG